MDPLGDRMISVGKGQAHVRVDRLRVDDDIISRINSPVVSKIRIQRILLRLQLRYRARLEQCDQPAAGIEEFVNKIQFLLFEARYRRRDNQNRRIRRDRRLHQKIERFDSVVL